LAKASSASTLSESTWKLINCFLDTVYSESIFSR
jgi:hypothetical protein